MTTEPTVGAPAPAPAHPDTGKKGLIISLAILFVLAVAVTLYWAYGMKHAQEGIPQVFTLYEGGEYQWYALAEGQLRLINKPEGVVEGEAVYPGGNRLSIRETGLEWSQADRKSKYTLVERADLTPESSFVSADGTLAVLFNEVTNMFDVFRVTYEGAYVSYAGSFAPPALPAYPISGGAVGPSTVVLHTGNPDAFQLYSVGDSAVTPTGTAALATPPVAPQ